MEKSASTTNTDFLNVKQNHDIMAALTGCKLLNSLRQRSSSTQASLKNLIDLLFSKRGHSSLQSKKCMSSKRTVNYPYKLTRNEEKY